MAEPRKTVPLVAVVTPVYNGNPYLVNTIASVQAQTYPNLVHILLDNASTDDTPAVIAAACDGPISIVTQRNTSILPLVDNWNKAISLTPPEAHYVKFLCADDLMRADCIERLVAVAESAPNVDFVTAVDIYGGRVKPHGLDDGRSVYGGTEILLRMFRGHITWLPSQHLFFRVTPDRLNKPFDPTALPSPDTDFVFRLLRGSNAGFVNESLFYTRCHANSQTTGMGGDFNFLYTSIQRLDRFASELLSPEEIALGRRAIHRQILRHVMAWRAMGRVERAREHLERLSQSGFEPTVIDYLIAVLTWPRHKLRKEMRKLTDKTIGLPYVTENDFLNTTLLNQVPA